MHFERFQETNSDYDYSITLLMGALESLASDSSLLINQNPEYLAVKALLASSLRIQDEGLSIAKNRLTRDYSWLFSLLKPNCTNKG